MMTLLAPERGGGSQNIHRVEMSLRMSVDEIRKLRDWFAAEGWSTEVDDINEYLDNLGEAR